MTPEQLHQLPQAGVSINPPKICNFTQLTLVKQLYLGHGSQAGNSITALIRPKWVLNGGNHDKPAQWCLLPDQV
jgi:hypothetical protein